ncbi:hypothetical protein HBI25_160770 [Parastagonospora nodorum]|nr:hypothetical protein HBI06_191220 [Parastagonospora nodorum]KAH4235523.1 hypothetical protein HBI05_149380 [Parastagonospora nodorum]KAH4898639.1 hypothetical protein HBI80_176510 [Parastagonospora nodorum]KAH5053104.1 hypothetical protein HBH96_154750 [Parastagonospora nodorum]KAH5401544.1 hypothetical protein HBI32_172120 [Parastagonospora nodorum]
MLKRTLDHSQHTAIAVGDALSLFKRSSSLPEPWTKNNDTHAMSPFAFEMKPNPVLFHYITPSTNDCSTIFTADKRYQHIPLDLSRIENESSLGSERSARSKSLLALGTALLEIAYRAVVGFGIGASAHRVCSKTRQGTATQLATIIKPRIIEIDDFANVDVSIATTNNFDEPQPKKMDYEVSQSSTMTTFTVNTFAVSSAMCAT